MRLHHEVIAGGRRHRVGSQGGAQSRLARVCRQYRGEPAHREPGRCCCGKLATSPRGASCDYCRERNRHYRRRYRAKVRASSRLGARLPARRSRGSPGMPRARCVDSEPSHELETAGEAAAGRLYRLRAALGARLPPSAPKPSHAMVHPADPSPPSLGAHAVRSHCVRMDGGESWGGYKVKTQTRARPCANVPSASKIFWT